MSTARDERDYLDRADRMGARLIGDEDFDTRRWALSPSDRAKVRPAPHWCDEVIDHFSAPSELRGAFLPWAKTQNTIRLRPGELSIWAGVNGHGKSMLLSQVVLSLTRQDQRICIASLEMKPIQTLARMARQALGEAEPGPRQVRGFAATLDGALWLYDQQGTVAADRMLALCRYCREELDVGHVVIDSLMKCGLGVDDYNGQKHFVDALSTYAKDSGLHIHLVAHSRKRENEREVMNKFDIKGAGDITDMADNVFNVWRNKGKEQALEKDPDLIEEKRGEPDALLLCDKQRNGDWEGRVALWFNRPALQYLAKPGMPPIDYMRGTPGGLDL